MIVPDINLLVYVYNEDAPQHSAARRWWERLLGGTESIGVPWIVATGFIRVISNGRITASDLSPTGAAELVNNWFSSTHIEPIDPGPAHMDHFRRFLNDRVAGLTWCRTLTSRQSQWNTTPKFIRQTGTSDVSPDCGGATHSLSGTQSERYSSADFLSRSIHGNRSHLPADRDRA